MFALKQDIIHANFRKNEASTILPSLQIKTINELTAIEKTKLVQLK